MKQVLAVALVAVMAVGSVTHQVAAEQVCYDLPAIDDAYLADMAAADEARRVALEAADEEFKVRMEEVDKLLQTVNELRATFKAADPDGYVEFLVAEDAGAQIDPDTMSAEYREFDEQRSKTYREWNEAKSEAYKTWNDAKLAAYVTHNKAVVAATDELNQRQLP